MKKLLSFTKKEWSYIFYDWAESAFTVVFATFIFPGLYSFLSIDNGGLTNDQSSILYQLLIASISIAIAVLSPILGTISDYKGFKDRFFRFHLDSTLPIFSMVGCFNSIYDCLLGV
jgi:MFS transporter, UMF1 family